jgi:YD repeat-containing protein
VVLFEARLDRLHSDISTGETTGKLDTNADLDPLTLTASDLKGRVQISAYWYDRVERQVDRVEYGTYGGATWTRPSTAPARSDTALRSTNAYGTDGRLESVTDPLNLVRKYEYDALGRRTKEIQNYVDGVPSGAADDVALITSYTDGLRTALTADLPSPEADQVTTYSFGTSKGSGAGDSAIARNDLPDTVTYPDSSGSSDVVSFAYNAQGQETWKSDQSGNVYETEYDSAGRMVKKVVSTLASGFDGAVRRQGWSYDALGRLATAVQYDATTAGNATDGVRYSYDAWANLERFEQDRNSAVAASGGDEYDVSYAWVKATNGRNTLRKTNMVLPSSRSISYTYRTSGGLHDEEASRVSTVVDDTGSGVTIAQYDYLGTSTLVRTRLNAIACFSRVYDGSNAIVDLDRFNRITTNRWTKDLSTDRDLYQTVITYDRNSNITSIEDNVHTGLDVKYTMDNVNRLIQAEEGTLSSGSITSKTRDQQWTLSHTGNWAREKLDLNGDGDFSDTSEHDDTRTHNAVNELTARDTDSNATNNFTLTYDAAGNLSDDGEHYEYEYDAFYRLRKVKNTSTQALVAEYRYNALNHRIGVHEDSDTDGDVDSNDKWYYDAFDERWRLLARFGESDTAPKEDFVPHQAGASGQGGSSYIDLVICRNRDADTAWTAASDGTLEERNYLLQNWRADVSAVVSGNGLLKEWVKYSSYGIPIGLPGGDTDSDGDCDATDITQVQTWITASAYDVRGDVDLDGDVDASDKSELQTNYQGITLGRGVLSSNGVASRKGYAGYEGLTNLAGSQWLARNRVLMAELGRWGRRDPLRCSTQMYTQMIANFTEGAWPTGTSLLTSELDHSIGRHVMRRSNAPLRPITNEHSEETEGGGPTGTGDCACISTYYIWGHTWPGQKDRCVKYINEDPILVWADCDDILVCCQCGSTQRCAWYPIHWYYAWWHASCSEQCTPYFSGNGFEQKPTSTPSAEDVAKYTRDCKVNQ